MGSNLQITEKPNFNHKLDLVYYTECPECHEDYIGEIGSRLHESTGDHSRKDRKSLILKHCLENKDKSVSYEVFRIIQNDYTNSRFKQI